MRSLADMQALLPQLTLALAALLVMAAITVRRSHTAAFLLTALGFAAAFALTGVAADAAPARVTPLLAVDGYTLFFTGLLVLTGLGVLLLSAGYLRVGDQPPEEYYLLLLSATLGCTVIVAASHFASLFLGLEILSVSLYGLIAYPRRRAISIEAGLKYLVLAGFSSAFLLFGMALLYAQSGTMEFAPLTAGLRELTPPGTVLGSGVGAGLGAGFGPAAVGAAALPVPVAGFARDAIVWAGLALLAVGIGFKLGIAPFHMWTPDVYQGAPAPVTAFIATASKGAVLALLLRFALPGGLVPDGAFATFFAVIAVLSMFTGNLLALRQENLKRLLAYSSIAHLGYVLVAFVAAGERGVTAVAFYLVAYTVTILGAFGVIALRSLERKTPAAAAAADATGEPPAGAESDVDALADYRGLGRRRPWLAATLTAMLLSLAGIPLTAGFIGKFLVIVAGARTALWTLVVLLAVNSALSIYYYLRVVVVMYLRDDALATRRAEPPERTAARPWPALAGLTLAGLLIALIWLGIQPGGLLQLIRTSFGAAL